MHDSTFWLMLKMVEACKVVLEIPKLGFHGMLHNWFHSSKRINGLFGDGPHG